jgi:hypothetical protein
MDMRDVNALKAWGRKVGRAGMSQAALSVMSDDKSYKGVMRTAGAMKAIAIAAQADDYWNEQVQHGFIQFVRAHPTPPKGDDQCSD